MYLQSTWRCTANQQIEQRNHSRGECTKRRYGGGRIQQEQASLLDHCSVPSMSPRWRHIHFASIYILCCMSFWFNHKVETNIDHIHIFQKQHLCLRDFADTFIQSDLQPFIHSHTDGGQTPDALLYLTLIFTIFKYLTKKSKWPNGCFANLTWDQNDQCTRKSLTWCLIKTMNVTYIKNVPQSSYIISFLYQILYRSQVSTVTRNVMKGHDKS